MVIGETTITHHQHTDLKSGEVSLSHTQKAQALFKTACVATAPCLLNNIPPTSYLCNPSNTNPADTLPPLFNHLTEEVLVGTINNCPPMKAPGPDGLQNWFWRAAWPAVKTHLLFLLKMITINGIIPTDWKSAKTIMLPEPGKADYKNPGSYRPIALLNTISKIFEKIITNTLSWQFESNHLLHPGHYGGRPDRSSQEAMVHLTSWIKNEWSKGKIAGALFADFKSAFPSVHHPRLLDTMRKNRVHPELLNIIHEFLTGRKTTLDFNGFTSNCFKMTHVLPQGSPLSPLL